jgi:hypothetical protein
VLIYSSLSRHFLALSRLRRVGIAALLLATLAGPAVSPSRADVSREAPPLYAEQIVPLLTPLSQVINGGASFLADNPSALVLLDEHLQVVDAEGRRFSVYHTVYKSLTEAGAQSNADDVYTYRRKEQAFHLVLAETIQPDGSVMPVKPNAVLLQSPQRQADYALYDDLAEVKIIYPNVKPGSLTHTIAITQDLTTRMPGEYTQRHVWGGSWPTVLERMVVTMPAPLAARLRINALGSDQPDAARETLPDGLVRLNWRRENIPARRYEVHRAPSAQVGPSFQIGTIASWDDIGRWFSGLLAGRDELSPALAAKVDDWTKKTSKRDELIRILLDKASREVRYTGLEFGKADYQPHSCNDVWENQYGDCKDKANLLVAFLRRKGIEAHIALVNTTHLGLIDRRAPDFRIFTHAIVAIPDGRGRYEFCDPTIDCAEPGMIGPSTADRDVLVVKKDGAEWVHTPSQKAGRLDYRFDLKLAPSGEISGWLNLTASGYYAADQRSRFRKIDVYESRRQLGEIVRGFFAGAEVVDVVTAATPPADSGPDTIKAYFIVPAQDGAQTDRRSLPFPRSSSLFLDMGTTSRRDSTYFLWQDEIAVTATLGLPPGLSADALPPAYQVETPTGSASAQWRVEGPTLTAELRLTLSRHALPAGEFGRFYQAMQSLQTWLAKPAVLTADATRPATAKDALQVDLPLMPTGEGQLDLVEKRYPANGNHALRRAALNKTADYFANDKLTVFKARLRLIILDWDEDKNQQALDQVVPLLAAYRANIPAETYAWGESVHGLLLQDLKRTDEALAIFTRMTADTGLSDERRALESLHSAELLEAASPDKAVALLAPAAVMNTSYQPAVNTLLARLRLKQSQPDELRRHLAALLQSQPEDADALLTHLVTKAGDWKSPPDKNLQAELAAIVRALAPNPSDALKSTLAKADQGRLARERSAEIFATLKARLAEPAFASLLPAVRDPALKTSADFKRAIEAAAAKKDDLLTLQLALQSLMEQPLGDDFPERLWLAASYADWREMRAGKALDEPIHLLLLDLADRLPPMDDAFLDSRLLRAYHLARKNDPAGERLIYTTMLATPGLPPGFQRAANGKLGQSLEKTGDYPQALDAYKRVEPFAADDVAGSDRLLRAVLINLQLDRPDEALRIIKVLENTPDNILKKTTGEYNIREFIALARTGRAKEFWSARSSWWTLWQDVERKLNLPAPGLETVVPVIPELTDLGRELGQAERTKTPALYWAAFRRLQSAARWLPSLSPEAGSLVDQACRIAPDCARDLRKALIAQLEVPAPMGSTADQRMRQLHLAINYHDGGLPRKTLDVVAVFQSATQPDDAISRAMHRVWGIAARTTKTQLTEAAARLAQDLANPDMADSRSYSVELLADLYKLNGKVSAESDLLARELANPTIVADTNTRDRLASRKERLGGSARLAKQSAEWVRTLNLPWYDFAEPADLKDPRLRNLDEVLRNPARIFNEPQVIKLRLLVAQDASGSIERQREALVEAYRGLLRLAVTHEEARLLTTGALAEGAFNDDLRTSLLWSTLFDAFYMNRPEDYRRWLAHPLTARFSDWQKKSLVPFTRFLEVDRNSVGDLKALVGEFTARELAVVDLDVISYAVTDLIRLGDLDATRAVVAGVPDWNLSTDVTQTKESLQLDFARQLRAAEAVHPVREALLKLAAARLPAPPAEPPAAYAARRLRTRVPSFSRPVTYETLRYLLKVHATSPTNLWFWHALMDSFPSTPENRALAFDLIQAALTAAPDDAVRADVIDTLANALDNDEPEIRARIIALITPYAQPVEAPLTTAQIRLFEIHVALRLGQPVDLPAAFDLIKDPELKQARDEVMLVHYTQTRDIRMLKQTVDGLSSAQLLAPALIENVIPALDLLGRKSEAALARGTAQKELKNAILESWAEANPFDVNKALTLAEVLGSPSPFPAGWVESVCARVTSPRLQGRVRLTDAWLRQDWKAVAKEAAAVVREYPSVYHYYWYQGSALARLGDKPAAIAALTLYTRYSKEELEYPAALALLKELGEPANTPASPSRVR